MPHSTILRLPFAALRCAALFLAAALAARAQTSITADTTYSTGTSLGATTVSNGATLTLNGGASSGSNTSVGTGDGLAAHFVLTNGATFNNSGGFNLAGSSAESAGTATVSGSGSTLYITNLGVGGDYSWGELLVSAGGTLQTLNSVQLGAPAGGGFTNYGTPGLGRVTIAGGSNWVHSSSSPFSIGYGSAGELVVSGGSGVTIGSSSQLRIGAGYGPGTIRITGTNSGLAAQGGTRLGMISSGTLTVADGGTYFGALTINPFNFQIHSTINIGAAAGESAAGAGVLSLAGNLTTGGYGATLQFNTTATSGTPYYLTNTGTSGGAAPAIAGYFRVINNAGYNVIAGSATYAGDTIVNGGTLKFLNGATVNGVLSGTDDVSTGLSNWSTGGVFVNGGTLDLGGGTFNVSTDTGYAFTLAGGTVANGTMSASSYSLQSGTADAVLAGTADVVKSTAGTVTLNAANTYTGSTTVSAGTLTLGHASALPSGTTLSVTSGGTLDLNGHSRTFTSSPGDGTLALGSATATFAIASDTTLATTVTGAGNLEKTGAAVLTLGAASTHTGATTVSAGTLRLGVADAVTNSSAVFVNNAATLDLDGHDQTVNGLDSYNFGTGQFDAGTVTLGGASLVTLTAVTNNWVGSLTGTGNFEKQGTATLNWLWGTNTFTGTLTVTAGTLATGAADVLSPNAALSVGASGTVSLGGYAQTVAGLSGSGAVSLGAATLTVNQSADSGFSGVVSGTGTLVKSGAGNLSLSGANTFSGGTTVTAGTLTVGTGGSISHASTDVVVASTGTGALTLAGGNVTARSVILGHDGGTATLALNAGTLTTSEVARWSVASTASFDGGTLRAAGDTSVLLNGFTSGSAVLNAGGLTIDTASHTVATPAEITGTGGLTKSGLGSLTLSGASTYSGATTVSAGTLVVNGSLANSAVSVGDGATLGGSGSISALSLASGASLAPGNSPGTLTAASAAFAGGSTYLWQINDAAGVAGTNWDVLNVTGTLTFSATAGDKWTFSLASLDAGNNAGLLANFNPAQNVSYLVASAAGGISGFDASAVTLDTGAFANAFTGTWSLGVAGNALNLSYTVAAVPEPSTYAALLAAAALLFTARRRRRARSC